MSDCLSCNSISYLDLYLFNPSELRQPRDVETENRFVYSKLLVLIQILISVVVSLAISIFRTRS